jgi:hypothetical protein
MPAPASIRSKARPSGWLLRAERRWAAWQRHGDLRLRQPEKSVETESAIDLADD